MICERPSVELTITRCKNGFVIKEGFNVGISDFEVYNKEDELMKSIKLKLWPDLSLIEVDKPSDWIAD